MELIPILEATFLKLICFFHLMCYIIGVQMRYLKEMSFDAKRILNKLLPNGTISIKQAIEKYPGEQVLEALIEKTSSEYKPFGFFTLRYKIVNDKLYIRSYYPLNIKIEPNSQFIIHKDNLQKIRVRRCTQKFATVSVPTMFNPIDEDNTISVPLYFEEYEIYYNVVKTYPNFKACLMGDEGLALNPMFLCDVFYMSLFRDLMGKEIKITPMRTEVVNTYSDLFQAWAVSMTDILNKKYKQ
jgi:hypothetical protein